MKVLFIGGSGTISTQVSKLAIKKGIDLFVLNRGKQNFKIPKEVKLLQGDIHNNEEIVSLLKDQYFDSIVSWISFTVDHVKRDYDLFKGHTKQYVFISSASAYLKPLPFIPITEDIPLGNKYWEYSENKKKCEDYLLSIHDDAFNVTIIRPSHTYDETMLVSQLSSRNYPYTMIDRMLKNKPIIIPDLGETLWTITYSGDFAHAFIDVLGNSQTYGQYYHLTGDKVYTWNQINQFICDAVGVKPHVVHIPTDYILKHFPEYKAELYGDKMKSTTFDNTKIKSVAHNYQSVYEYKDIVKLVVQRLISNKELQEIDDQFNQRYDLLIQEYTQFIHQ
ncbi:MAG: NAD-dependent epimerase/dehydratase family protein [Firmicutes bacterium]|nr:NAD-dependent epimerase/dehydratase family protein [Bacillota bacterium]